MKKNGFITFCCAMIPGFGQMYQGYMKRGISLTLWFTAIAAFAGLARMEYFTFLLLPVWAYSFFDTFNIRSLSAEQRAAFGDNYIPSTQWLGEHGLDRFSQNMRLSKIAGWVLVGLGVLVLAGTFWDMLYALVWRFSPTLAGWFNNIPALLIAALVILLGLRLLRKSTAAGGNDDNAAGDIPPTQTGGENNE